MTKKRAILPVLFLVLALALVLYPPISNAYHARHHSAIETSYLAAMENTDAASLSAIRQAAEDYNSLLSGGTVTATVDAYESLLNPNRDGIMCYVEIPKLGVSLPVYHGTEADTLADGVGHLVGSSLPVGGESTHAVLSVFALLLFLCPSIRGQQLQGTAEQTADAFLQEQKQENAHPELHEAMVDYKQRIYEEKQTGLSDP